MLQGQLLPAAGQALVAITLQGCQQALARSARQLNRTNPNKAMLLLL